MNSSSETVCRRCFIDPHWCDRPDTTDGYITQYVHHELGVSTPESETGQHHQHGHRDAAPPVIFTFQPLSSGGKLFLKTLLVRRPPTQRLVHDVHTRCVVTCWLPQRIVDQLGQQVTQLRAYQGRIHDHLLPAVGVLGTGSLARVTPSMTYRNDASRLPPRRQQAAWIHEKSLQVLQTSI